MIDMTHVVEFLPADLEPPERRSWLHLNLTWSVKEPLVVYAKFRLGKKDTDWLFSPELLANGLLYPIGYGDVFLSPDPRDDASVLMVLEVASRCGFRIPRKFLRDFLTSIEQVRRARGQWERIR